MAAARLSRLFALRTASVPSFSYHGAARAQEGASVVIDVRSDVLTQPSEDIRKALAEGTAKDDVFNEDPTVKGKWLKMMRLSRAAHSSEYQK